MLRISNSSNSNRKISQKQLRYQRKIDKLQYELALNRIYLEIERQEQLRMENDTYSSQRGKLLYSYTFEEGLSEKLKDKIRAKLRKKFKVEFTYLESFHREPITFLGIPLRKGLSDHKITGIQIYDKSRKSWF